MVPQYGTTNVKYLCTKNKICPFLYYDEFISPSKNIL